MDKNYEITAVNTVDAMNTIERLPVPDTRQSSVDQNVSGNADKSLSSQMTDDEKIDIAAAHILQKYKAAFQELAK